MFEPPITQPQRLPQHRHHYSGLQNEGSQHYNLNLCTSLLCHYFKQLPSWKVVHELFFHMCFSTSYINVNVHCIFFYFFASPSVDARSIIIFLTILNCTPFFVSKFKSVAPYQSKHPSPTGLSLPLFACGYKITKLFDSA